jgi:hypothetical protein
MWLLEPVSRQQMKANLERGDLTPLFDSIQKLRKSQHSIFGFILLHTAIDILRKSVVDTSYRNRESKRFTNKSAPLVKTVARFFVAQVI